MISFLTLMLINPFNCFYKAFRFNTLNVLYQNIISPFGIVGFKEFFLGDILTSMVKPLIDFYVVGCFFLTDAWLISSKSECETTNTTILAMSFIPFHIRFWQCINRYYYTRQAFPHLVNAGKYMATIIVLFIAYFKNTYHKYEAFYFYFYIFATLYSYAWDICMDWGLIRGRLPGRRLLRDKLKYPPSFYYLSALSNLLLRFAWLLNFIPEQYFSE